MLMERNYLHFLENYYSESHRYEGVSLTKINAAVHGYLSVLSQTVYCDVITWKREGRNLQVTMLIWAQAMVEDFPHLHQH
jgi:hypothetical protein